MLWTFSWEKAALTAWLAGSLALGGCWQGEGKAPEASHPDEHAAEPHVEPPDGALSLTAAAQQEIGLATVPAQWRAMASELVTSGEIEPNANREAHVTTRVPGRVSRIDKNVGDRVRAGDTLALLDSVELGEAQSAYMEALARLDLATSTYERQRKLFDAELIAQKDVLQAENQRRLAQIDLEKSASQLRLYGFEGARIAELARTRALSPTVPLLAPIGGTVRERHLTLGEMLEPNATEPAFLLSDLSTLWVNANLYERDLAKVKVGQRASIKVAALPERSYEGRVSLISSSLDKASRTAKARISVSNSDGQLRPDMTATVRIAVGSRRTLAIPEAALLKEATGRFVFVRQAPERFIKRVIEVGPAEDGWVAVLGGLKAGEHVVTKGSYSLKSELVKDSLSEHGH